MSWDGLIMLVGALFSAAVSLAFLNRAIQLWPREH